MINNATRIGNFTSSEIVALMSNGKEKGTFGKPALTYIEKKNMERRLGRSIQAESEAKPLAWGNLLEGRVFTLLGLEYKLCSKDTLDHPSIPYWKGSPDSEKFDEGKTVVDYKCPITLGSFCKLVDPLYNGMTGLAAINEIRDTHDDGDKFYYQLVSNSILTGAKYAELIVYMPYKSELEEIKKLADGQPGLYWLQFASDDGLPYLPDGGYYKNINVIRFEVPEVDKKELTMRVRTAGSKLIKHESQLVTT
jgi:hypothetical protein